jgi:hypothetical protein
VTDFFAFRSSKVPSGLRSRMGWDASSGKISSVGSSSLMTPRSTS